MSQRVSVAEFLNANGYHNYCVNAATLDKQHKKSCGYNEIFADAHENMRYNEYCYHYRVKAAPDKILKLDFVQDYMLIRGMSSNIERGAMAGVTGDLMEKNKMGDFEASVCFVSCNQ